MVQKLVFGCITFTYHQLDRMCFDSRIDVAEDYTVLGVDVKRSCDGHGGGSGVSSGQAMVVSAGRSWFS